MKMTQYKETTESNNKNDINDTKSENIEIDNKTVCKDSFLSQSEEHNLTSVNVSAKSEETDSDDEPLLKKFQREIKFLEEKEKEKENEEEKNKKKGSGYDDNQLNNNINVSKQEIVSSDDECILDLVKREYAKEMKGKPSFDDSMSSSSTDSDTPILEKYKNKLFNNKEKEFVVNLTNNTDNSSLNNILHTSYVSNKNIKIKHMETVTTSRGGSNSYSSMRDNLLLKEEKTEKCDKDNISSNISSSNNNINNSNNKNKSKVQKSIKKTPNKTPTKRNTTNNSNINIDNKNNNNSTTGKTTTTTKTTKTKKTEKSIKKRKKTTKRKKAKRKTKPKAKSKTKKDTTRKTTTAKKTKGRTKGTQKATKSSKSKDANYNNLENDSILIGNFDPHNRSNKEKLVAQLLIRWWYILPEWPPADYNYEEELKKRKLKLVPLEAYENEEDIDENGFRKVYQISAFPGIFRDAMGTAYDLRDKETCPSFNNFMKKSDLELLELICQAIKNQLKCLKNSVYDESITEKKLEKELKDIEAKLNKLIKKGKNVDKGNEINTEVTTEIKTEVKTEEPIAT